MNYSEASLKMHETFSGKIEVISKANIRTRDDLSTAYTPGVAEPCRKIHENKDSVYQYTSKGNVVAVVTDGTAVLGLGDIGPKAGLPVMEGKAILFKEFANVDAFPICLDTKDVDEIVKTVKLIAPGFGDINLEGIGAPRCFEIEERLKKELDIPVFHDDQHGTAIAKLLLSSGVKNLIACDRVGILHREMDNLDDAKRFMLEKKPDLILLDVYLPRENGIDFLKWKRKTRWQNSWSTTRVAGPGISIINVDRLSVFYEDEYFSANYSVL